MSRGHHVPHFLCIERHDGRLVLTRSLGRELHLVAERDASKAADAPKAGVISKVLPRRADRGQRAGSQSHREAGAIVADTDTLSIGVICNGDQPRARLDQSFRDGVLNRVESVLHIFSKRISGLAVHSDSQGLEDESTEIWFYFQRAWFAHGFISSAGISNTDSGPLNPRNSSKAKPVVTLVTGLNWDRGSE